MNSQRPNPDQLLARFQADEVGARRGKLKIFFGYAAGVGKTYAMLEAAHRDLAAGVDVVVGYVEPHDRPQTQALLQGLPSLPPLLVPYRGVTLKEFDLDKALARRPRLIVVDELAHTNTQGMRHAKRWQDVEELLEAGMDVYSTLNVQHVESLNDVIAQITGVVVHETLPDSVMERADSLELIDITPEELMARLRAGKVYLPTQAELALRHFFQKANLVALREMSLREAANRLRREVDAARQEKTATRPWASGERLLVCIGPSPTTAKLIRTAKRMAVALGAEWLAVAVQNQDESSLPPQVRQQITRHLSLAEELGAETHTLIGAQVAPTILEYARSRNVTKIVVGKTAQPWWKRLLAKTVVDDLLEQSDAIDVYVVRGESDPTTTSPVLPAKSAISWPRYAATLPVILLCGLVGWLSHALNLAEANTIMVFLLGVTFVAIRLGRGPAVVTSLANVLVFDFFFVPPYFSFSVADAQYLFTFAVMLGIGLLHSTMASRLRDQLRASQQQERRTAALYRFTKQLGEITGVEFLVRTAGLQLREIFGGEVVLFLRDSGGRLTLRFGENTTAAQVPVNALVAQWVADHDQVAGLGTDTLPNGTAWFIPLIGSRGTVGALGLRPEDSQHLLEPETRRLAETCASLIALSLERDQSLLDAHQANLRVETEQLRNSLLNSVSHDLRTPLAAIAGSASSLLTDVANQNPQARQELLQSVVDESRRLTRLVDNLLDMTRLEAGAVTLNKQWHVLEEIVGSALGRVRAELGSHVLKVDIPAEMPLLALDGVLMEQVLVNLLENALRYTRPDSILELSARLQGQEVEIRLADNGPGLPPGSEKRIFEKFYRGPGPTGDGRRGVGLGLAICQAGIQAHGGTIQANNRPGGGAEFIIKLPRGESTPGVSLQNAADQPPVRPLEDFISGK